MSGGAEGASSSSSSASSAPPFPELAQQAGHTLRLAEQESGVVPSGTSRVQSAFHAKFQKLEHNFNSTFLQVCHNLRGVVENEPDEVRRALFDKLDAACDHWTDKLEMDMSDMDACRRVHQAVGDQHALLLAKDERIWSWAGKDLLTEMLNDTEYDLYDQPITTLYPDAESDLPPRFSEGLNTPFLFDELGDGLDDDSSHDSKDALWTALIELYKLSVLLCIVLEIPLVKELIDVIISTNPDLNRGNILPKVMGNFRNQPRLRRLVMQLMQDDENSIERIFNCLQKVISAFSQDLGGGSSKPGSKLTPEEAAAKIRAARQNILESLDWPDDAVPSQDVQNRLWNAIEADNEAELDALVEEKTLTTEHVAQVQRAWRQHAQGAHSGLGDLGNTMKEMMEAFNSQDEEKIQEIMRKTGSGLNFSSEEFSKLKQEMDSWKPDADEAATPGSSGDPEEKTDEAGLSAGAAMKHMMNAMQTQDEKQVQSVLRQSGLDLTEEELQKWQAEMDALCDEEKKLQAEVDSLSQQVNKSASEQA